MIELIVPTDFSNVSKNALHYAAALYRVFRDKLTIVHCFQKIRATGHFKSMDDIIKGDAEKEMQLLKDDLGSDLCKSNKVATRIVEGDVSTLLQTLKSEDRHQLLVMGSSGTSKIEKIFGSTAKAVINHVKIPTLIIPPDCQFIKPTNIVVANDGMMTEANLQFLLLFANAIGAHMFFLHVGALEMSKELVDRYIRTLGNANFSFHNIENADPLLGINEFTNAIQGHMVIMAKRKRNFLQKIFSASYTNRRLFHSRKPLLILHRET